MDILIYSHDFLPVLGGIPIASRILAEGLCDRGHRVTIFTTTLDPQSGEPSYSFNVQRSARLLDLLRATRQSDVVITNGFSRRVGAVASLLDKPFVTVHQMAGSLVENTHQAAWSLLPYAKRVAQYYTVAGSFFHVGVSTACLHSKNLPTTDNTSVVFNPIDPLILSAHDAITRAPAPSSTASYDLLYVGRLIDGKGVYVLMDALRKLDAAGCSMSVCMAGSGDEYKSLRAVARQFDNVNVHLPGALNRNDLAHAYSSSKILVIPTSTHQEGMPLVIAEALLFGLPIIGSDQPMIAEGIGDAGLTFANGSADSLANLVLHVLSNPPLHSQFAHEAARRSALFLPEKFITSIETVLSRVKEIDCSPSTIRSQSQSLKHVRAIS